MNIRVIVEKQQAETFGHGKTERATVRYNMMVDVEHVSTVASVAKEKGYKVVYVGTEEWHGENENSLIYQTGSPYRGQEK